MLWTLSAWPQNKPEQNLSEENLNEESLAEENSTEEPAVTIKPLRPPGSVIRPRTPPNQSESMTLLAKHFSSDASVWLSAGQQRFFGLWQKDRSGFPKGALLIIHAEGEHPAWPQTTKTLHDTLPDYGWATLAISLPNPDHSPIPERELPVKTVASAASGDAISDATVPDETVPDEKRSDKAITGTEAEPAQANASEDSLQQSPITTAPPKASPTTKKTALNAEQITEQRLEFALEFLHDQGQFNISVLGSSSGAIRAQDFIDKITPQIDNPGLKKDFEKPIRALVIVNGRNRLPTMADTYKHWFKDPEIPVLDIFLETDSRNRREAKNRKILARQKKVLNYKQVSLSGLNNEKTWGGNQLSRRVRGFLDNNAAGVEIDNATIKKFK